MFKAVLGILTQANVTTSFQQ